jgi:hypothetical protein
MLDAVTSGRSSPKGALAPCPAVKTIGCVLRPSFEDQRVLHTISGSTVHSPSSARGTECKRLGILGRHASGAVEATCATLLCARPVGPREAAGYLSADIDAALIVQALCLVYRAQCGKIGGLAFQPVLRRLPHRFSSLSSSCVGGNDAHEKKKAL